MALCALCLLFSLWAITIGWHRTIFDNHGFRQAQTAISTYYFTFGSFFHYETPVLGPPWSIPFEFPVYEAIVAATAKILPLHLDQAGRLISVLFFYATFFPLFVIVRSRGAGRTGALMILALLAVSPFYVFWSRTFMIEPAAMFLAVSYLALVCAATKPGRMVESEHWELLAGIAILGSLAGLTKVTTFAAFFLAAVGLILLKLWTDLESGYFKIGTAAWLFLSAVLLPMISTYSWTVHADSLKLQNPLAGPLTSHSLATWNFGTLAQRLSLASYTNFAFMGIGHVIDNLIGSRYVLLLSLALLIGLSLHSLRMFLICVALYLSAIAIFFNLHLIHSYYAYANGVFLIAAVGFCLSNAYQAGVARRWAAIGVFAFAIAASVTQYFQEYYKMQKTNAPGRPAVAAVIDRETDPNSVLLIYGLDWSSELPYQARRRAIMAGHAPESARQRAIHNLGMNRISSLVVCGDDRKSASAIASSVGFTARREVTADDCNVYFP